jgi:hypothetical protein
MTSSFLLYMTVFAALAGGKVPLYRPLQAPAGGKVVPAGGNVAPAGGKVAAAGGKVLYRPLELLYRPLENRAQICKTRETAKTFKMVKILHFLAQEKPKQLQILRCIHI